MLEETMNNFKSVLQNIRKDHVYIQTHNFPDPDAIASAYGLSVLLGRLGVTSSICYKGKIERYSTNRLIESLGIDMTNLSECSMDSEDEVILVDAQKGNSNIIDSVGDEIICIDHHPSFSDSYAEYRYMDVRPEVGACSTIIAQYFFDNNIQMDKKVATALIYGIKSDTQGLSRGVSQLDLDVYQILFRICDKSVLKSLEHCSLKFEDLKAYASAINSIKVYDNVSFANTGRDCPDALIASISDFMLELAEVDFSVAYSQKPEGMKFSIRSIGKLDAGAIAADALKDIGGGGGHAHMAGGYVPFDAKETDIPSVISYIEERFIEAIADYSATHADNIDNNN